MDLNTTWLWAATLVSTACWGIHTFVGGAEIVPLLKASDLPNMPKYVLYFVWHIVTIVLAAITAGFALAALFPAVWALAVQSTVLSLLIAMLGLGVSVWRKMGLKDMPQWTIFLIMAATGAGAIWL